MLIAQANLKSSHARAKNLQKHLLNMEYPWDIVAIQHLPPGLPWMIKGINRTYRLYCKAKRPATDDDHPIHYGYDKVCGYRDIQALTLIIL